MLNNSRWRAMLLLTVVAAATGFYSGRQFEANAQKPSRVYELRTYTAEPGRLDALLARFRNHTVKLFEKHGIRNVGYWIPSAEPAKSNTLIYVVSHDSPEAAKQAWSAFRNDPEWQRVRTESEKDGKIVTKVDSVYLDPTDFSPMK